MYFNIANQFIEYRFESVFIPAAKEDAFGDIRFHHFDFKHWPKKNGQQQQHAEH